MTTLVSSTGSRTVIALHGDPVVVGGRERQLVALEPGQDAGEDRPGLVARRGERRLVERLAEDLLLDPGDRPLAGGLDGREVVGRDALDVRFEPAGPDVERLALAELERRSARRRAAQFTRSVRRRAGTDVAPSDSILPGTQ